MAVLLNFKWGERNLYKLLPVLSAQLDCIYVFSMLTFKRARTYENSKNGKRTALFLFSSQGAIL